MEAMSREALELFVEQALRANEIIAYLSEQELAQ
jgi:hypothetical protein